MASNLAETFVQIQNNDQESYYIVYKSKQYPINFDLFKKNSEYFYSHKKEFKKSKIIPLIAEQDKANFDIPESAIQNFIDYVQCKSIPLNNENILFLIYLAKEYKVNSLIEVTNKFLDNHHNELALQILLARQDQPLFETSSYEDIISSHFPDYIKNDKIFHLKISILYRIFQKYQIESKQSKSKSGKKEIIDFLFKCLDNYGREASVLFSNIDFGDAREECVNRLLSEYESVFDFHFVNSAFVRTLYETQNDNLKKVVQCESKIKSMKDEIDRMNDQMKKQQIESKKKEEENEKVMKMMKEEMKRQQSENMSKNIEILNGLKMMKEEMSRMKTEMQKQDSENKSKFKENADEMTVMKTEMQKQDSENKSKFKKNADEMTVMKKEISNMKLENKSQKEENQKLASINKELAEKGHNERELLIKEVDQLKSEIRQMKEATNHENETVINTQLSFLNQIYFNQMKSHIDIFNYLSGVAGQSNYKKGNLSYIYIPQKIDENVDSIIGIEFNMTEILFKEDKLNSTEFKSHIKNFSEFHIEIKYPSDCFDDIFNTVNELKNFFKTKLKISIFITNILKTDQKFHKNTDIDVVKIDSCVKEIESFYENESKNDSFANGSFEDCHSLTQVLIPCSVTKIDAWAFYRCESLKKVFIPSSVTEIGSGAFSKCRSLKELILPPKITEIKRQTIEDCSSLTQITIPSSVTSIKYNAFEGCSSLAQITIPSSVTEIEKNAFIGCSSLTQITIPSSININEIGIDSHVNVIRKR